MKRRSPLGPSAAFAAAAALVVTMTVPAHGWQGTTAPGDAPGGTIGRRVAAFAPATFRNPGMEYRPGVRWWWSGGAVEKDGLIEQLRYLAANGFGSVEINPFDPVPLPGDAAAVVDIYSDAFYDKLEAAVAEADRLGIIVDLNMGTGWNANSPFVTPADSMGNLALGRTTLAGSAITTAPIDVPAIEKSQLYFGVQRRANWVSVLPFARLQGVLVAELTGELGRVFGDGTEANFNVFNDGAKAYRAQVVLNPAKSYYFDSSMLVDGRVVLDEETVADINASGKNYEVVALYFVPAGAVGFRQATTWPVVDHLDAARTAQYINEWAGAGRLREIIEKYDNIRALFNDSYEFNSDTFYNEELYALARDVEANGLGYDYSPYLAAVYRSLGATPAFRRLGTADTYLTFSLDAAKRARLTHDYGTLVSQQFLKGMAGFQSASNALGLLYRQQAYNPPLDTLASAQFVDIPESEQPNEMALIRASSGAHLYGRNLVTAEQYTLGNRPFTNTLEMVKVGYDIMATSGINNFFYHGLNYDYGKGSERYGENGWAAFPTIGIDVSADNTLWPYFAEMNKYAARLNYLMQIGRISRDVALYMPFNASLSETAVVRALNANGYAWGAINDASIQSGDTVVRDGRISANGGTISYGAIIVESTSLPVATMERLNALAADGAAVIFYGATPNRQPGYAGGDYLARDAAVAALGLAALDIPSVSLQTTPAGLVDALRLAVVPPVTYDENANVRFIRRTLPDGSELSFIRNIGAERTQITVRVDDRFKKFYWLDQSTGRIHRAKAKDGVISFSLEAGKDQLGRPTLQRSMSVALLASPTGRSIRGSKISEGRPSAVSAVAPAAVRSVDVTSLTVSADNLDGVIGGPVDSVTFTQHVLGRWNDPLFNGGILRPVVADGRYTATVTVPRVTPRDRVTNRFVLDLGEVHSAARVTVNGRSVGQALFAPHRLDVTNALRSGANRIEITVTPRKINRYVLAPNGQYNAAALGFLDAGLVGPLTLQAFARTP